MTEVEVYAAPLRELLTDPAGAVGALMGRIGADAKTQIARLAPVRTGRLRRSITYELRSDGHGLVLYVGSTLFYSRFVETGTRHSPAEPFVRPGAYIAAKRI